MTQPVSSRIRRVLNASMPIVRFNSSPLYREHVGKPETNDFAFGNPHEMPLAELPAALQRWSVPQDQEWFAYKMNEPSAQDAVIASLQARRGVLFDREDIFLTTGAFAALAVALSAILDQGDEVIFISPPWFFYEPMILAQYGVPVRVQVDAHTNDLDLAAIEAALTPRTRAIIINSPNNPTGRIYPPSTLQALGELLTAQSGRTGQTVYLLSDEAYSRIIYDGRAFPSPTAYYPYSLMLYTYGKTLLAPAQRLGYLALPPTMPLEVREALRPALFVAQLSSGYAFPNALMQYALPELENVSIDLAHLQLKRDHMVNALCEMGYHVQSPEGTFYLLPRSPLADDWKFCELLAEYNILCLPGEIVEAPGYFRISLTANDAMIDRALPGFKAALQRVG